MPAHNSQARGHRSGTPQSECPMKLLRIDALIEITGLSRMTVYRMEKRGEFPNRRRLGANSVAWIEEEVDSWIAARPAIAQTSGRSSSSRNPELQPPGEPKTARDTESTDDAPRIERPQPGKRSRSSGAHASPSASGAS
jgi:prophage regulatory protein